ncbi:uncharacterized protein LOC108994363 [Juglans regia]|uniref:Uncharacterized protein LOC108994363 n=1 Tax=Juglans regia TaxID=51240 RepID=A0A6P9F4Z8_JUGRE|nr:uncharacterized protein LOC108994363 [Juglans regia]
MADANRSNQNSTQIMDAEGIASKIHGKLVQYRPPPLSQCSIFKVPSMLRRDHEKAFTPEVVSIGPFHRNNTQLQEMENNKLWYLKCLLNRTRTTELKSLVEAIESIEQDCRKCYSEVGDLTRDEFIEMMVIDGCFILEFLCRYKARDKLERYEERRCMDTYKELELGCSEVYFREISMELKGGDDPVFKTSWMPRKIVADLLLLENQLPWCVLVCLLNLMTNWKTTDQYKNCLLDDLVAILVKEYIIFYYGQHQFNRLGTHKHLLDCFRNYLVGSCTIKRPVSPPASSVHPKWMPIKSVTELLDFGVGFFRAPDGANFLDVKFEEGRKMKMPAIVIEENTESLFRNLIAFEHCDPRKGYEITSYAALLDCLIKSPEDARHLEQKHILRIIGLSNEDRASFLMRLLYNNDTSFHGFLYSDLCHDVNVQNLFLQMDGMGSSKSYVICALNVSNCSIGSPYPSYGSIWGTLNLSESGAVMMSALQGKFVVLSKSSIDEDERILLAIFSYLTMRLCRKEKALDNINVPYHQQCSRLDDLVSFSFSEYKVFPAPNSARSHEKHTHLLDCFRNCLVGSCTVKRPNRLAPSERNPVMPVKELIQHGIHLIAKDGDNCILDVKFEEGKMKIPVIVIKENSESVFRNLIAFEHCDPRKGYEITSYAALLHCLIKSPEDAPHLEQKHILRIIGLSNEDRASFLNRLLHNNDTSFYGFLYSDLCQDVNNTCHSRWTLWKATGAIILENHGRSLLSFWERTMGAHYFPFGNRPFFISFLNTNSFCYPLLQGF